jgi:hypothetical protein
VTVGSFLVERYVAGGGTERLHQLLDVMASADFDASVRYRGSIIVPGDEWCLSLFDAADADAVRRANDELGLPVDRVLPADVAIEPR